MLKPIEKGCTAVIISGVGMGEEVVVGEFIGSHPANIFTHDFWELAECSKPSGIPDSGTFYPICPGKDLLRIDGYATTNDQTIEEIEQEQTA